MQLYVLHDTFPQPELISLTVNHFPTPSQFDSYLWNLTNKEAQRLYYNFLPFGYSALGYENE